MNKKSGCSKNKKTDSKDCYKQTFDVIIKADVLWAEAHKLRDHISTITKYPVFVQVNETFRGNKTKEHPKRCINDG